MAIRLEHQPVGISGLAAYAAGVGRAKERKSKYVTDLLQSQQARADKYNLLAQQQQFILGRDREGARMDAAADARRNAMRVGEIELDARLGMQQDESRAKDIGEKDNLDFSRSEFEDRREYARSTLSKLPPIPEYAPADVRRNLEKSRSAIAEMATSKFDLADPDTGAAFDDAVRSYQTDLGSTPKPSQAEQANRDTVYRDATGKAYDDPAPDRTAFSFSTGKSLFEPTASVETVPFRGQQVPVEMYQEHVKGIGEAQKQWDQGYANAVTTADQAEFKKNAGPRPQSPPSAMDLRYPAPASAANSKAATDAAQVTPAGAALSAAGAPLQDQPVSSPSAAAGGQTMRERAIAAAQAGDANARRALEERGVSWDVPAVAQDAPVAVPSATGNISAGVSSPVAVPVAGPVARGLEGTTSGGAATRASIPVSIAAPPSLDEVIDEFEKSSPARQEADQAAYEDLFGVKPKATGGPTVLQQTIAADQAGDRAAQQLLDERGFGSRWRKKSTGVRR